jgi:membrane associated rhomboid family serine protease
MGEDRRTPWLTIGVTVLTAAGFVAQLVDERVRPALERDPAGLQWTNPWRVVTPLLIQSDGWTQAAVNLVTLVFFGVIVENRLGRWRWVVLYLAAGVVGQLLGYLWEPAGGGNSVAVCGLAGAVIAAMLRGRPPLPGPAYLLTPYFPAALLGVALPTRFGTTITIVAALAVIMAAAALSRGRPGAAPFTRPVTLALGGLLVAEALTLLVLRDQHGGALLTGTALGLIL